MNTKPLLRWHVRYEIDRLLKERFTEGVQPSCINCLNFDEKAETCNKFNQRPPARVIALSCQHHEDTDDIPF